MKRVQRFAFAVVLGAVMLAPIACKEEGAGEKAGKALDKELNKAGEKMDEFKEKMGAALEKAKEEAGDK